MQVEMNRRDLVLALDSLNRQISFLCACLNHAGPSQQTVLRGDIDHAQQVSDRISATLAQLPA